MTAPLEDLRVLDLSRGIAGSYCTHVLSDAGADVLKIEPPEGDPLRKWASVGAISGTSPIPPGDDGALFHYLSSGKRSAVLDLSTAQGADRLLALATEADVLVEDLRVGWLDAQGVGADRLRAANPRLVVVSITDFGSTGPWSDRPGAELTIQALSGSVLQRGNPEREPIHAGGAPGEWMAGTYAVTAALTGWRMARKTGIGTRADISKLEGLVLAMTAYATLTRELDPNQEAFSNRRCRYVPAIEPAKDGLVGFTATPSRMWQDFSRLIGKPEWAEDESLVRMKNRQARIKEIRAAIAQALSEMTVAEVESMFSPFVPCVPVGNGALTPTFPQFVERGVYVKNPAGFVQPRSLYTMSVRERQPVPRSPRLDADAAVIGNPATAFRARKAQPPGAGTDERLPLAGNRVADFSTAIAGAYGAHILGMMGAEIIKVESTGRPDTLRSLSVRGSGDDLWWEMSPQFLAANTNKRGITLDLNQPEGLALAKQLISISDLVMENFSVRVMGQLGLDYEEVHRVNPRAVMLRLPAFGLDGPWRDRVALASTQDQVSGLAWLTGYADEEPYGSAIYADWLSATHAANAALIALELRDQIGEGFLVEAPMVENALQVAAEAVVEHSAYGELLHCDGNRGPYAVPQGLYQCLGDDRWVAIAVRDDADWAEVEALLGDSRLATNSELSSAAGRRAHHDLIDAVLTDWCRTRTPEDATAALVKVGVPAAPVLDMPEVADIPQLAHRRFFEGIEHPVAGKLHAVPGFPFTMSDGPKRWNRTPAPTLGQYNDEVLGELLGVSPEERTRLRELGVIGERPSWA
jgi:crotonobetainyl-CoA:carnitine CoA-transferase CaiB-like acyl-CoA transferase